MAAFVEFSLINLRSCNYPLALSAFRLPFALLQFLFLASKRCQNKMEKLLPFLNEICEVNVF